MEAFAVQMNATAKTLGAQESHFVLPHGLYDPQHYSTAYDLAVIGRAALQQRRIAEVVRTPTWDLLRPDQPRRMVINSNKLLWRYAGADGVKTGWVRQSGHCLVASATRDGWQLIAVVLNSPRMYSDAAALLDYGFSAFALTKVGEQGEVMATTSVIKGSNTLVALLPQDVFAVIRRGASISHEVVLTMSAAPIPRAAVVGHANFQSDGDIVARAWLVAQDPVPTASIWTRVLTWFHKAFK